MTRHASGAGEVGPGARLLSAAGCHAALLAATPGALWREGSSVLAVLALVPWALACSRPGPKAWRVEWLAGAVLGLELHWVRHVWAPLPLWVCAGMGVYLGFAGALLRRLARRLPLGLACGLAWTGMEALRALVPPPFGLGWQLLAHHAADEHWLAGSTRVWGPLGLSLALAATGGTFAGLVRDRGAGLARDRGAARTACAARAGAGLAPLGLAALFALLVPAPETADGPLVLLVQPAFEQARKQRTGPPELLHEESRALTRSGLAALERAGEPPPDLVVWGETMLFVELAHDELAAAVDAGARSAPWNPTIDARAVRGLARGEETRVHRAILGPGGLLPPGTSFASGALLWVPKDGRVLPANALVLWTDGGATRSYGGKAHLAPFGETMIGLERFGWVRSVVFDVAGYVPDMYAWPRTEVLEFPARAGGGRYRFTASVCFDNAFPAAYAEPLARGALDFHLVVSNEAWFLESFEMDQMVAFSRLIAVATGRSFVRCGNAGVSVVIDPRGRDVARLEVNGRDRHVPGTLAVRVPVPRPPADAGEPAPLKGHAPRTPFCRFEPVWSWLFAALPLVLALFAARSTRRFAPDA